MRVLFYKDASHEWRWRLRSRNGRTVACSAEGYKRLCDCRHGWEVVLTQSMFARTKIQRH